MTAYLFQRTHFDSEAVATMTETYDRALRALSLNDREDSSTLLLAMQIIYVAGKGERDARRMLDAVLSAFREFSAVAAPTGAPGSQPGSSHVAA
jgi:hypothetical protein